MKDVMNQVFIAQKSASNIITKKEKTVFTRSLLNTTKLMEDKE
jgi:hypothetical protein